MKSRVLREAYYRLFGEEPDLSLNLKFSRKFKDYNANVRRSGSALTFNLSHSWMNVNDEILIGLVQHLCLRILKKKPKKTRNISLYLSFLQNLHLASPKKRSDPLLLELFNELNRAYFSDLMETPSLVWGLNSKSVMANYSCKTDTITVNQVFKDSGRELLSYLLYHEMLHKKLKFKATDSGKMIHHSSEFRKLEKNYPNREVLEKMVNRHISEKTRVRRRPKNNIRQAVIGFFR